MKRSQLVDPDPTVVPVVEKLYGLLTIFTLKYAFLHHLVQITPDPPLTSADVRKFGSGVIWTGFLVQITSDPDLALFGPKSRPNNPDLVQITQIFWSK